MQWSKLVTYLLAAITAIFAVKFPSASSILVPIATGLTGLAIKHPADVAAQNQSTSQLTSALSALQSSQKAQIK